MTEKSSAPQPVLWRWDELSAGLCDTAANGPDVTGVKVDSRSIEPGDLFVALPGDPGPRFNPSYRSTVDGHDFVGAAAGNGAVGALVHKDRQALALDPTFPLLQVGDTYDGLWSLGALARSRMSGDVVAVTGSSGKTTAKHYLAAALGGYAPPGSFNNHIGVPLSLANTPIRADTAVFEIGTNHPGEIEPLARMVRPSVAILLNVHLAHIANFDGIEELRKEKVSIFNSLTDKSNSISEDLVELGFGLTFGESSAAHARVRGLEGDLARIDFLGKRVTAKVPGGGVHRAKTAAATMLACHLLGRDIEAACNLPDTIVPAGRGNIIRTGKVVVIDDSYNANPSSMLASLTSFGSFDGPEPKVAVIGEMLELGDEAERAHLGLKDHLKPFDQVCCVGAGARALAHSISAPWFEAADEALLQRLLAAVRDGGCILVKGSNRVFWQKGFVSTLVSAIEREN